MAGRAMLNASAKLGVPSGPWRVGTYGELWVTSNLAETNMAKRYYLSTRKDRSTRATPIVEALKARGWERTFVWKDEGGSSPDGYAETALAEIAGVREADVLIVLLPGGYGTHVEIGAALALGKPVILHAPDRKTLETPYPCIFHYHPSIKLLVSDPVDIGAVLACLPRNPEDALK
jgi:hypothetical protein